MSNLEFLINKPLSHDTAYEKLYTIRTGSTT